MTVVACLLAVWGLLDLKDECATTRGLIVVLKASVSAWPACSVNAWKQPLGLYRLAVIHTV